MEDVICNMIYTLSYTRTRMHALTSHKQRKGHERKASGDRSTLQAPQRKGHESKASGDRSTLQAPQRKGHERKSSGDRSALLAPQRKGHERKGRLFIIHCEYGVLGVAESPDLCECGLYNIRKRTQTTNTIYAFLFQAVLLSRSTLLLL